MGGRLLVAALAAAVLALAHPCVSLGLLSEPDNAEVAPQHSVANAKTHLDIRGLPKHYMNPAAEDPAVQAMRSQFLIVKRMTRLIRKQIRNAGKQLKRNRKTWQKETKKAEARRKVASEQHKSAVQEQSKKDKQREEVLSAKRQAESKLFKAALGERTVKARRAAALKRSAKVAGAAKPVHTSKQVDVKQQKKQPQEQKEEKKEEEKQEEEKQSDKEEEKAQKTEKEDTGSKDDEPENDGKTCPYSGLPEPCKGKKECAGRGGKDARSKAFREAIKFKAPESDPRGRVLEVAAAMGACQVHFGSCGATAEAVFELAGLSGKVAEKGEFRANIFEDHKGLNKGRELNCYRKCPGKKMKDKAKEFSSCPNKKKDNVNKMRQALTASKQDSLCDKLKPGDWLWIYNGNSSCSGMHSFIFLGWKDKKKGKAHIVDGSYGRHAKRYVGCLRSSCPNWKPINRIMRAVEVRKQDKAS